MNINTNNSSNVIDVSKGSLKKVSSDDGVPSQQSKQNHGNTLPANSAINERVVELKPGGDSKNLEDAVKKLNENVQQVQREIHFSIDDDSGNTVIKIIDLSTKEVIRQLPNEEALRFARQLVEGADVALFSEYT